METLDKMGLAYPWQRMLFGAAFASAVCYHLQPEAVFRKDGKCRPFALTSTEEDATKTPFFLICLAGTSFGIFI